jgi:hypothetical protein
VARAAEDINRPGGYKRDPWASLTGGGRTWTRLAGQRVEEAPVGTDNCGGWLVGVGVERSCSGNRALTGVGVGGGWASTCGRERAAVGCFTVRSGGGGRRRGGGRLASRWAWVGGGARSGRLRSECVEDDGVGA